MATLQSERSALHDYARHHCLCWPANTADIDITHDIPSAFNLEQSPACEEHSSPPPDASNPLIEKLIVHGETSQYLISIFNEAKCSSRLETPDEKSAFLDRALKLELPVLRADPDLDLCQFLDRSRSSKLAFSEGVSLSALKTVANDDHDSLGRPPWCHKLPEQLERTCGSEKLQIDLKEADWLRGIFSDTECANVAGNILMADLPWQQPVQSRLLTPPLSPLTSAVDPSTGCLSSPVAFPFPSENCSPSVEISTKLNHTIFKRDTISPAIELDDFNDNGPSVSFQRLKQIFPPLGSDDRLGCTTSPERFVASRLKLDETLLPRERNPQTNAISSDDSIIMVRTLALPETSEIDCPLNNELKEVFHERVDQGASKADILVANETLQEADTTMRLQVPKLDFSVPLPPWKRQTLMRELYADQQAAMSMLAAMKLSHFKVSRLENKLQWVPIPMNTASPAEQEQLQVDKLGQSLISLSDLPHTSLAFDNLVWKLPGLRLLDEDPEEEALGVGQFDDDKPLPALIRKGKAETEVDVADATSIAETLRDDRRHLDLGMPSLFPRNFSVTDNITSFIWIKTGQDKRRKIERRDISTYTKSQPSPSPFHSEVTCPDKVPISNKLQSTLGSDKTPTITVSTESGASDSSLYSDYSTSEHPKELIALSHVISHYRTVFRGLLKSFPSMELRAVDHESDTPLEESEKQADITFQPSSGILLTTVQKIKQRPLPGQKQKEFSALHSRVLRLSTSYDRLIIVVVGKDSSQVAPVSCEPFPWGHGLQDSLEPFESASDNPFSTEEDIEALSSLKMFTASLIHRCTVDVASVNGKADALTHCIAGLISK